MMNRKHWARLASSNLVLFMLVFLLLSCSSGDSLISSEMRIGDVVVPVEVADTVEKRRQGLAGRTELRRGTGMLFVPDGDKYLGAFWMKGMLIPLDFVWVGERCTVITTIENVAPEPSDKPSSEYDRIGATEPAVYVLELNAGDIDILGIDIDDPVLLGDFSDGRCAGV